MPISSLLFYLLACPAGSVSQEAPAVVPVEVAAPTAPAVTPEQFEEHQLELVAFRKTLASMDDRLARLELVVADLEEVGIGRADRVTYDPSRARLDGRTVQAALDDLARRIQKLGGKASKMGQPGEGLFQMHEDDGPMGGARLAPGGSPSSREEKEKWDGPPPSR